MILKLRAFQRICNITLHLFNECVYAKQPDIKAPDIKAKSKMCSLNINSPAYKNIRTRLEADKYSGLSLIEQINLLTQDDAAISLK